MATPENILQERLVNIRDEFLATLNQKLHKISLSWHQARKGNCNSIHVQNIKRLLHSVAETASTFGLVRLSEAADKLEQFLYSLSLQEGRISKEQQEHFLFLLESLASVVENKKPPPTQKHTHWGSTRYSGGPGNDKHLVFIVESDHSIAEHLAANLVQYGYQTRTFSDLAEFEQALSKVIPEAIIIDMVFPGGELAGAKYLLDIKNKTEIDVPVIFVSARDDIEARLQAVRAGSSRYFTKPVDINRLLDSLSELITGIPKEPYRIMLVDDDRTLTDFYKGILGQHGMQVIAVNDPMQVLDTIVDAHPELILMDIDMPGCSGVELASIIRQQEQFAGISIIFLSSETEFGRQVSVLEKGGDDFLTKPVDPGFLVRSIATRVSKARTLSNMSYRLLSALREVENRNLALDHHSIITITNINGEIVYVNDKFCDISGYSEKEILGQRHSLLDSDVHSKEFFDDLWDTIRAGKVWKNEMCEKKKNGDLFWADTTIVPFTDEQKRPYQYVAIQNDITSRIEAEQNLLEARDIAVKANQSKSDFLSKMSHELRTPLNAILGFSQLLHSTDEKNANDNEVQYSQEIYNAGTHLLDLINDTLDLSRIEVGQLKVDMITVPLTALLNQCCSLVAPIAQAKGIRMIKTYNKNAELAVNADPLRLKQILVNLLSNAIKYNRPEGSVEITYRQLPEQRIAIEITDTGTGIPEREKNELFKPFTRLNMHKQEEGVGIGLALSKRLIELMQGDIGFNSRLNEGTCFWLILNEDKLDDMQAVDIHCQTRKIKNSSDKSCTLLCIEDNKTNLSLVKEILNQRPNIKLVHAETAESGLELIHERPPDIILMDIHLPGMSGLESVKVLKKYKQYDDIPVIAISAYASKRDVQQAYDAGFNEYITKPINVENFLNTIDNLVEQQNTH